MEFYCYSPSETFVVLTADQFVGRDDGLLQQRMQKVAYFSATLLLLYHSSDWLKQQVVQSLIVCLAVSSCSNLKLHQTLEVKSTFNKKKLCCS